MKKSNSSDMVFENSYSKKNHFLAGMLCFFLGRFGVHRFYVGKYISGIVYLSLFIIPAFILNFLPFDFGLWLTIAISGFSWFLSIIDLIMILYEGFEDKTGKRLIADNPEKPKPDYFTTMIVFLIGGLVYLALGIINDDFISSFILSPLLSIISVIYAIKYYKN